VENTCRVTVGRLMEIRILAGFATEADIDAQIERVKAAMTRVPVGERVVIAADWRQVPIMPAPVAARAHALLTTTSDRIERSGILAMPDSPTALMQFFRLVRESQHPSRTVVTSVDQLVSWLRPLLTAPELTRLNAFLLE
jgi:precorrin isomerase